MERTKAPSRKNKGADDEILPSGDAVGLILCVWLRVEKNTAGSGKIKSDRLDDPACPFSLLVSGLMRFVCSRALSSPRRRLF